MNQFLSIFSANLIEGALAGNVVIIGLLGLSSVLRASDSRGEMLGLTVLLAAAVLLGVPAGFALLLLLAPLMPSEVSALPVFALVMAGLASLILRLLQQRLPLFLQRSDGLIVFALLGTGSIGVALLATQRSWQQAQMWPMLLGYVVGAALGITLIGLALQALSQRLAFANAPAAFRGLPLKLLSLGIAAMAISGLAGLS